MLVEILKVLAQNESWSLTQLAHRTGHSTRELTAALAQLENMGYIKHEYLGDSCASSSCDERKLSGCTGCPSNTDTVFSAWTVTERGKQFASV